MLLYINSNSNVDDLSTTSQIANAFLDEYEKHHHMKIKRIDLIDYKLPELDREIRRKDDSPETHEKIQRRNEALNDFLNAEIVVIAAPIWNFSYPAVLKTWIDAIVVSNKTFKYTPEGPIGLAGEKKVLLIQTSSSKYSKRPHLNFGLNHLEYIMKFMGINHFESILAEGLSKRREEVQKEKIDEARELARKF